MPPLLSLLLLLQPCGGLMTRPMMLPARTQTALRSAPPTALLPKAIIPLFFIPTYVQIGYAIEGKFFESKGPFTRLIKSDFVQKSGATMKRVEKKPPGVRPARLTAEVRSVVTTFQKEYATRDVELLWAAALKCYGNKDRALEAVKLNPQIINPSYSFPNTMLESNKVLRTVMSEKEALEVRETRGFLTSTASTLPPIPQTDALSLSLSRVCADHVPQSGRAPVRTVARPLWHRRDTHDRTDAIHGQRHGAAAATTAARRTRRWRHRARRRLSKRRLA